MINIGKIYNIEIANGESVDMEVIEIKDSAAVLEMLDFGGPLQKYDVSFLETLTPESRNSVIGAAKGSYFCDVKKWLDA